jgi:outer membrane protein
MKQKRLILLSTALFLMSGGLLQAQEVKSWSLKDCIDYAIANNIQLQKSRVSLQESEVDLKTAKAALFPSLSFSSNQNLTNRPYSENNTNIVNDGTGNMTTSSSSSKTTYNGSYGLNAQWTVWNGGKRINNIKQQKLNTQMSELSISESENNLQEQITQLYVQILYTTEAIEVNKQSLALSEMQRDRAQEMFKVGSIAKSDVAQLEAQVANDKYLVVNAETTLRDYKLQLKQLLEIDGTEEMTFATPIVSDETALQPIPSQLTVYENALALRPEIQSGQLNIQSADLGVRIARAGYMPSVSLSAGIGSSNGNGRGMGFGEQLKQNWNNSLGLTFSLPIFDNRQNKSAVEKAKLQRTTSALDLADKKKTLFSSVERLWLNAQSAQLQFSAAMSKVESSQISYDLAAEQFRLGLKNTVELVTEKNNLLSAQQDKLQSKYTEILNAQLLNFYQGGEINL